jgi:hypothetical protein
MGIEIAESLISQNHYCPEQRLWRHVLLNAVEDTRILQSDRKSSIHKMEAHQWITKENKDFNWICWQSGWDPEIVKEQYFKAVRNGNITFTHRQLKWIEYYRLYLDLKKEANEDKRKALRKKVEKLRKQVLATTTAIVKNLTSKPNLLPCV